MRKLLVFAFFNAVLSTCFSQLQWQNVDSAYGPLPDGMHVFFTNQAIDTAPFRAFYVIADLKNKKLDFTTDTTLNRRLTPLQFYTKNNQPLLVVNGTFFSFETNRNLNVVIENGRVVSHNLESIPGRGKDTLTYRHPIGSALGIAKNRRPDVAWVFTDSLQRFAYASQLAIPLRMDSSLHHDLAFYKSTTGNGSQEDRASSFKKWKMQAAIGGGPVLLQDGRIEITNNEEWKFAGKAINDKHPRTAMGYTKDNKLIILVVEGRNKAAGGASLTQEAQILKDLGCIEALNLDGGGSSCLLVNGKETIKASDPIGQRPVPAVFIVQDKTKK